MNIQTSSKWVSFWAVGCHSLWYWCNMEMRDENYHKPLFSWIYVQRRVEEYGEAMKNNVVADHGEKLVVMV